MQDQQSRREHASTGDYHHQTVRLQRCALDWMLSPKDRAHLAREQVAAGRWYYEDRFNFRPIKAELKANPLRMGMENLKSGFQLRARNPVTPQLRSGEINQD
jgi:hypothetical protein